VVADGCSLGGKKSVRNQHVRTEVGAVLLTAFIRSEIPLLLASHTPINLIPQSLYHRCVSYLANIARTTTVGGPEVLWDFIERNLLATVVGFVMNDEMLVTFSAGDGMIIVNDEFNLIDQDNMPKYLAYHLVDRSILGEAANQLPDCFDWMFYPTKDINRFAVCTDGVADAWKGDPNIINGIWDYQPQALAGLQWWINKGSKDHLFRDDCTIIAPFRILSKDGEQGDNHESDN
jgi:hypothetical protein